MFKQISLPYATSALEPYIDQQTVETHYGKHHAKYDQNLQEALQEYPEFLGWDLVKILQQYQTLPIETQAKVFNNGGQVYNHNLYFEILGGSGGQPEGELAAEIEATFGSFSEFKEKISQLAATQFGSGWAWLSVDGSQNLSQNLLISKTSNADSPIFQGHTPILTIDVWEHAYYLKYQNRRPDYLEAFWSVVNWKVVEEKYLAALNANAESGFESNSENFI